MKNAALVVLIVAIVLGGVAAVTVQRKMKKAQTDKQEATALPTDSEAGDIQSGKLPPSNQLPSEITLVVSSPGNGATVTSPTLVVRGKTIPKADVFVNEKETIADANGNFSVTLTLDEGENVIVVFANDANGNAAEVDLTVNYNAG